jgi:hypothetical protein
VTCLQELLTLVGDADWSSDELVCVLPNSTDLSDLVKRALAQRVTVLFKHVFLASSTALDHTAKTQRSRLHDVAVLCHLPKYQFHFSNFRSSNLRAHAASSSQVDWNSTCVTLRARIGSLCKFFAGPHWLLSRIIVRCHGGGAGRDFIVHFTFAQACSLHLNLCFVFVDCLYLQKYRIHHTY